MYIPLPISLRISVPRDPPANPLEIPLPVRRTIPWPGPRLKMSELDVPLRLGERIDSETRPASQQVMRLLRTVPFRSTVVRSVQLIQTRQLTAPRMLG